MLIEGGTKYTLYCAADDDLDLRDTLYRVPAVHITDPPDPKLDSDAIEHLAKLVGDDHPVVLQARAHSGTRLFVWPNAKGLDEFGPVFIPPAHLWDTMNKEWLEWTQGTDEDFFEDCPHGIHDCVPFAKINHSPDLWYVITDGPHKGKIGFWSHDDPFEDEGQVYADSLDSMIDRICTEIDEYEGILSAFAINPCPPTSALDKLPEGTECLYPVRCERMK